MGRISGDFRLNGLQTLGPRDWMMIEFWTSFNLGDEMDVEHCTLKYRIGIEMAEHGQNFDDVTSCTISEWDLEANVVLERETIPEFEIRTADRVYYPVRDERFLWVESRIL